MEQTFYEAEWYTMPPRDRKVFALLLSMAQNAITLKAGGVFVMTLDWYSDLFKKAYNLALVIGDTA